MPEPLFPALAVDPPDRVALRFPDRSLTYPELSAAAATVARSVAGKRRVAVLADSRAETCAAVIGALQAGVPVVPVNPKSGRRELAHIVADAEPDALLLASDADPPTSFEHCPTLPVDLREQPPATIAAEELGDEAPALIVYTSGTTGAPKGVVLPRRAITSNLDALAAVWAWSEDDVVVHGLPLFHVHGLVLGILGPVRLGGTVRHLARFTTEGVEQALSEDATVLFGVPTMYRRLADAAEDSATLTDALARARLLVSGSAALPATEHERLDRLTGQRVLERYGMTETLMNTAIHADGERRAGFVGPPLPGVELRLVDDDGAVIASPSAEAIGEIEVRGPNLFLEYLNRPDATAEAFRDGWFRTGDLASQDDDGYVRIVGRRSTDLIKTGGYKLGAGEIENALRDHPAVDDAAVTGEPDDDLGERVVAWVVLRDGADAPADELVDHVASELAPHKRPRIVHFVSELPRNAMGKVQKQRLAGH